MFFSLFSRDTPPPGGVGDFGYPLNTKKFKEISPMLAALYFTKKTLLFYLNFAHKKSRPKAANIFVTKIVYLSKSNKKTNQYNFARYPPPPSGFPPLFISIGQQGGNPNEDIW